MKIGVPKETFPNERRVALVPPGIPALTKLNFEVIVESDAGKSAGYPNKAYEGRGVGIVANRADVFSQADVLLQVRSLGVNPEAGREDLDMLRDGQILVGLMDPLGNPTAAKELASRSVSSFAMELMPRITRAQNMDTLSSMATVAGYKAVLLAAEALPRMFPMLMTAAGTISPAKVFVIGAGVAGLQAIATARRLGAVVHAYDVRPAVKEQVESLGAKFVELEIDTGQAEDKGGYAKAMDEDFYQRQREMMAKVLAESDVVITTAAVPGKKAPILITGEMVGVMQAGSVIVDLAAERGGNCELTKPDETVVEQGITIIGHANLPSTVPYHASQMYSKNLTNFLTHLTKEGSIEIDTEDEITRETLVTREGEVVHPRVREALDLPQNTESEEKTD